jgi:hypothetical protein
LLEYLVCCRCGERSAVFREFCWKYRLEVVTTAVPVDELIRFLGLFCV